MSFEELKDNFALFDEWDDRYAYLIDLGRKLPALPDVWRTETTKVRGCMSQVWLVPDGTPMRFAFAADSDSSIVKGLIAVLATLFIGQPAAAVAATDAEGAFKHLGLEQHLSPNRRNGFVAMVGRIKDAARATASTAP
ncbi:MAG: SufE family protein [Rhodospirillaceae bacterium]|nr:MAG: SufE family protein [Rhodospirillaceae bacterium]